MSTAVANVTEIQGLYGPYSFSEKLLQKIWLRGDFDRTRAMTTSGQRVSVLHPGKWNLLGGPDFRGARLRLGDGAEITGDIELHLRANDWAAHGHARDHEYDDVILHVVLFPPKAGEITRGAAGREIPVLALLPLLHHDLEAFAADEAVEIFARRPAGRMVEELGQFSAAELARLLREHAEKRWRLKTHFAQLRLRRLGWEAACHHAALEILGYRFNRAPMLRLAGRFPLSTWISGEVGPGQAWAAESEAWSVQGVRPANQPRTRLAQYTAWVRVRPDWPTRLVTAAAWLPEISPLTETRTARRDHAFGKLRATFAEECGGSVMTGTRLDTLVCDGWLPLLAARTGDEERLGRHWFHWFAGDLPPTLSRTLKQLGVFTREQPACNGAGQGLLAWILQRETSVVAPTGRGA